MSSRTGKEGRIIRRRLANAYLSSVVSISLVLLLVGMASLLIVNARNVSDYFKENMQLCVVLSPEVPDGQGDACVKAISSSRGVRSARLVTREEGMEDLKKMLGEDFLDVFETSPVPVSVEVTLEAAYVSPDSIPGITSRLAAFPYVEEVNCQQSLVEALNTNLARISLLLGVFILLLLFISFVLINNTVRLNVFSRRFTVHTMKLVGATRSFIRRPFLVKAVWQGLLSALLSILFLSTILYALRHSVPLLFEMFTPRSFVFTGATVFLSGMTICVVSTYIVVNKLISLDKNDLYY